MEELEKGHLRQDVEIYIRELFPTYFDDLDNAFVEDVVQEVAETSAYEEGRYNDSDISLAFQRVALGRMGCPEWENFKLNDGEMKISER